MKAADLVTIGVQKVAQVHETHVALAWSRRIFRGSATVGYCYVVEFLYLLWRAAYKTNGRAIGNAGRLTVNRFGNAKG